MAIVGLLLPGTLSATTRDVANTQGFALALPNSVLNEISGGLLTTPYDELQQRPFNLLFVNLDRNINLSPWNGQEGDHRRYVNALIGNNGNVNVRGDSDVWQGAFIQRQTDDLTWAATVAYFADEIGDSRNIPGVETFNDTDDLNGFDIRGAAAYRLSDSMVLGGGITIWDRSVEETERTFQVGAGGFFGADTESSSGIAIDGGVRKFIDDYRSWEALMVYSMGDIEADEFSETIDATGATTDRLVVQNLDIGTQTIALRGGYNRLFDNEKGEVQFQAGYTMAEKSLDNSDLAFSETGGVVTPSLTLLGESPVSTDTLWGRASTIFLQGPTEILLGAGLALSGTDGSTRVDSGGVVEVNEAIDDSQTLLDLIVGFRQPLWSERISLVASAQGNYVDWETSDIIDGSDATSSATTTTTRYAIGIEGVYSHITFDLAWLFGETASAANRQVIDFDRIVLSATMGW
ncbi:hypothetical protein ABI59_04485 [Acidobacteria bacterium Mor1]|nr:hypothetical protein ABI59_04485 [Acidobacteria bacterium Mor1]